MRAIAMTLTAAVAVATAASSAAAQYLVKEVGSFHIGGRTATLTGMPVKEVAFSPGMPPLKTPNLGLVVSHPTLGIIGGVNMRITGYRADRHDYESGVADQLHMPEKLKSRKVYKPNPRDVKPGK